MKTQNRTTEPKSAAELKLDTQATQRRIDTKTFPVVCHLTATEITILEAIGATQSKDIETMATVILAKSLLSRITNAANDLARWNR